MHQNWIFKFKTYRDKNKIANILNNFFVKTGPNFADEIIEKFQKVGLIQEWNEIINENTIFLSATSKMEIKLLT